MTMKITVETLVNASIPKVWSAYATAEDIRRKPATETRRMHRRQTMLSTPEIIQTNAHPAAVIHPNIPRDEMMKVFGAAVAELMAALAIQGVIAVRLG